MPDTGRKKGSGMRRRRKRGEEGKLMCRYLYEGIEAEVIGKELGVEKEEEVRVREEITLEGKWELGGDGKERENKKKKNNV